MNWLRRIIRWNKGQCLVCGQKPLIQEGAVWPYFYCSIACACLDGTFNVWRGWIARPKILCSHPGGEEQLGWYQAYRKNHQVRLGQ